MRKRSTIEEWETIIAAIENCTVIDDVMNIMHNRMKYLGFDRSAYWLRWPRNEQQEPILLTSYPQDFVAHYVANDFAAHDMVGKLSINTNRPFSWEEIAQRYHITKEQKRIFYDSGSVGLREGASVPIHGPNLMKATFSVASNLPKKEFEDLFNFHRHEVHTLATYAHEKMLSLGLGDNEDNEIEDLTPREKEIMLWIVRGETYEEVADRLFIQKDTVKKHLMNIRRKLRATNGPHATSVCLTRGILIP